MRPLPEHPEPDKFDYSEYCALLKQFNVALQGRISNWFNEDLLQLEQIWTVLSTGSDGRYEKGLASKLEFIILHHNMKGMSMMMHTILKEIASINRDIMDESVEIKNIASDSMSFYQNDRSRAFPTRLLDSVYIAGSQRIYDQARSQLIDEFQSKDGKSLVDKLSDRKREYKKTTSTGKQRYKGIDLTHFDLESGLSTYDPEKSVLSFKAGPLRYAQFAIAQALVSYARTVPKKRFLNLLRNLPSNTEERLQYLKIEDALSLSYPETQQLGDTYNYFVWQYNRAQHNYGFYGQTKTQFDVKETKERLQQLSVLLEKPLIKSY